MDIETNSVVSEENIKSAIKFGIDSSDLTDTKEYTIAFLKRLLVQRKKVDMNLLETHLNPQINKLWQEVLSSLDERNRKMISIRNGSLIFTLFCPTSDSLKEIQNSKWRIKVQGKVDKLLNALGL